MSDRIFPMIFFSTANVERKQSKKCWVKYPRGSAVKLKRYTDCTLFSYYRLFAATSTEWIVVLSGECCWKSASHATRQRPSLLPPAHRRLSLFEWPKSWAERGRGRYYHQQPFFAHSVHDIILSSNSLGKLLPKLLKNTNMVSNSTIQVANHLVSEG